MPRGIHLRYLGEDVRVVEGVGVFQKGTVAFTPRDVAVRLISGGDFEAVSGGPTAQAFIVRIGPETLETPAEAAAGGHLLPDDPAEFERELEEEERRLTTAEASEPTDEDPA